jgi:hypothetical protein
MANLIPEGIYTARATSNWILSETTQGTPYVRLEFELLDGSGRRIHKDFYFSEKSWKKSVESLRVCGWQGDDVSDLSGVETQEVVVKIVHELITDKQGNPITDDEGHAKYRAVVAWVGKDHAPKPMEATKLSSFRDLMKARLQQLQGAAPAVVLAGATGTDDQIPF